MLEWILNCGLLDQRRNWIKIIAHCRETKSHGFEWDRSSSRSWIKHDEFIRVNADKTANFTSRGRVRESALVSIRIFDLNTCALRFIEKDCSFNWVAMNPQGVDKRISVGCCGSH